MKVQLCQYKRKLEVSAQGVVIGTWEYGITYVNAFNGKPTKILDQNGNEVPEADIWQSNVLCTPTCFIDDGR